MRVDADISAAVFDQVLDGTLTWVTHHLAFFDPLTHGTGDSARSQVWHGRVFAETCSVDGVDGNSLHALAELAGFSMRYAVRRTKPDARARGIATFVSDVFSRPWLHERVQRDPAAFPALLKICVALEQCGAGVPRARQMLQKFILRGYPRAVECTVLVVAMLSVRERTKDAADTNPGLIKLSRSACKPADSIVRASFSTIVPLLFRRTLELMNVVKI